MKVSNNPALGVSEAASFLGLAKISVYKLISSRSIPHYKLGRRVIFDPEELIEWRNKRAVHPVHGGKR